MERILIDMKVRNHPGVMSRIAGIFSRRAVNIEEIAVMKETDAASRMVLLAPAGNRTTTVVRELSAHYDVLSAQWREFAFDSIFSEEAGSLRPERAAG